MLRAYVGSSACQQFPVLKGIGFSTHKIMGDEKIDRYSKLIQMIELIKPAIAKIPSILRMVRRYPDRDPDNMDFKKICFILNIFKDSDFGINRSGRKPASENNIYLGLYSLYVCPISRLRSDKNISESIQKELEFYEGLFITLVELIKRIGTD